MNTLRPVVLCVFLVSVLQADDRNNPRGVGMARTVNATSYGFESLSINPSRLALFDNRAVDIALPNLGFQVRTELFSYEIYQKYFTGEPTPTGERKARFLTSEDKDELLNLIPENAGTWTTFDVTVFGIAIQNSVLGGIGFNMTDHVGVLARLSRDFFRMAAFGLDSAGSVYDFSGTDFGAWWWREYTFTYAREIPAIIPGVSRLTVGASYKMVRGYGVFETVDYRTRLGNERVPGTNQYRLIGEAAFHVRHAGIDILQRGSDAEVTPFPEPAGKGSAFDFGLTAMIGDGMQVSAAVVNIGSIDWDLNVREARGAGDITVDNPFSVEGTDSLKERLKGQEFAGEPFSTSLPTKLRVGVSMRSDKVAFLRWLPGRLLLAADYTQGFNESLGNTTTPRLSVGAEYRIIPLIPLRTGFALGGDDSFRWSAGFGLDFYVLTLDFATENFGILFSPSNFQMAQFSFGMRLKI